MAEHSRRRPDAVGADVHLTAFIAELKPLRGAFEVARSCLRYAYTANLAERQFDSAAVNGLDHYTAIVRLVGGKVKSALTKDVVEKVAALILKSENPPLAAWCLADIVSVAVRQDFTAHLQSTHDGSEPELRHMDAFSIYPKACKNLYGPKTAFSERASVDRDPSNPTRVSGLALWIDQAAERSRFRIIVDKAGGDAFNVGLNGAGLDIALVQPNRRLEELNVDWLSEKKDADYRFFGISPADSVAQRSAVTESVYLATKSGASIVLMPELTMTKSDAAELSKLWDSPSSKKLNVVVAGSFHDAVDETTRHNTAYIHLRDFVQGVATRTHHKTGKFTFEMTKEALEALVKGDQSRGANATRDLAWTIGKVFREDITRPREIRVYPGTDFSTVVLICADFIDEGVQDVLRRLRPSLVLICNMTPKVDGFDDAAKGLIRSCQATTVMVNNPALWPAKSGEAAVDGAVACMPIRPKLASTVGARFAVGESVLVFNPRTRGFSSPQPGSGSRH